MAYSNPVTFKSPNQLGGRLNKNPSCNEILPRLYLGDICIASNREEITRLGITDMITIEIKPLQPNELAQTVKRYLYINLMDHSKQDILSHFETSNEFIETALKVPTNKVYVHCVAGISRSASLVIAYVMKTRSMSYTEAYELVQQKRRVIDPNEGFVRQLTLYHRMGCKVDIGNLDYRKVVFDALVFEFRLLSLFYYQVQHTSKSSSGSGVGTSGGSGSGPGAGSTSERSTLIHVAVQGGKNMGNKNNVGLLFEQYYNKLHLQQVCKFPQVYDPNSAFKCNKCRAVVFYAISVIENKIDDTPAIGSDSLRSNSSQTQRESKASQKDCPFIFIEPQPWMSKNVLERDGNLECYKCKRKLGKFDWTSGESCTCNRHNSHLNNNIFKIMRKKVDPS